MLATASALALGLVACDGTDDASPSNNIEVTAVTIETGDLFFAPDTLEVSADGVTITVENVGLVEHDLVIDEIGLEIYVDVNETATETVVLSAGSYDYYCSIPGHREAGMEGIITAS